MDQVPDPIKSRMPKKRKNSGKTIARLFELREEAETSEM